MSEEKPFVKDAKMLLIEEHFNDELEDILWRLRQVEEKTFDIIAKELSFEEVKVSVEEVATWLAYLNIDSIIEKKLIKTSSTAKRPQKQTQINADKLFDPRKAPGEFCSDSCSMAAFCKYYERYEGKKCVVDLQTKQAFLSPLKNYIEKTYDRDPDLRSVYINVADQIASIYQVMKRKERILNIKGITQIERKVDPTSGKIIENEVPNPLASDILSDSKQIMAMLKELAMTPKSMTTQDTGESDPASLTKALQEAEKVQQDKKVVRALKQQRYNERPEITSKDQLLAIIEEKMNFDKALSAIENGDLPDNTNNAPEKETEEQDKILNDGETQSTEDKQVHNEKHAPEPDVPEDVLAIIGRINKTEENK